MGIREEVAGLLDQADAMRRIAEEIETEGRAFWQRMERADPAMLAEQIARADLQSEREEWERDLDAVAQYEEWEMQRLLNDADAEEIAIR